VSYSDVFHRKVGMIKSLVFEPRSAVELLIYVLLSCVNYRVTVTHVAYVCWAIICIVPVMYNNSSVADVDTRRMATYTWSDRAVKSRDVDWKTPAKHITL